MPDPTPPPGDRPPSGPCRVARRDHAVLAWLVVEADLPDAVYLHLVDALLAWARLMGEHLFPTEHRSRRRRRSSPGAGRDVVAA